MKRIAELIGWIVVCAFGLSVFLILIALFSFAAEKHPVLVGSVSMSTIAITIAFIIWKDL